MGNKLHKGYKKINASGTGWKLFQICNPDGKVKILCPVVSGGTIAYRYKLCLTNPKRVIWDALLDGYNDGFCFFLDKDQAIRSEKAWKKETGHQTVVLKINYYDGLGEHEEGQFVQAFSPSVAICKSFELDKKYKKYSL